MKGARTIDEFMEHAHAIWAESCVRHRFDSVGDIGAGLGVRELVSDRLMSIITLSFGTGLLVGYMMALYTMVSLFGTASVAVSQ